MTVQIRDSVAADVVPGGAVTFEFAMLANSAKGGTAILGSRILYYVRVGFAADLEIAYATNGPNATPVYRDRGTIDKLNVRSDMAGVVKAIGTHVRFTITNRSPTITAGILFYGVIL